MAQVQLKDWYTKTEIGSVANGLGASLIGVEDAAGVFTGTEIEAILLELYNTISGEDFWSKSGIGLLPQTVGDSIGLTGTRISKGWFTDLEVTNAIAGDVTGTAATVTGAAQTAITSLGTLTGLTMGGTLE